MNVPGTRILVLANDRKIHEAFDSLLCGYGITALSADRLGDAQEISATSQVDAVVLQAGFSGSLPGLHFVKWLRARAQYRKTPVAVMIKEDDLQDHEVAAAEGMGARVFRYPAELAAIVEHLASIIEERLVA